MQWYLSVFVCERVCVADSVWMCERICMYLSVRVRFCQLQMCICVCRVACVCLSMCVCLRACVCVCVHAHVCVYATVCASVCVFVSVRRVPACARVTTVTTISGGAGCGKGCNWQRAAVRRITEIAAARPIEMELCVCVCVCVCCSCVCECECVCVRVWLRVYVGMCVLVVPGIAIILVPDKRILVSDGRLNPAPVPIVICVALHPRVQSEGGAADFRHPDAGGVRGAPGLGARKVACRIESAGPIGADARRGQRGDFVGRRARGLAQVAAVGVPRNAVCVLRQNLKRNRRCAVDAFAA